MTTDVLRIKLVKYDRLDGRSCVLPYPNGNRNCVESRYKCVLWSYVDFDRCAC